MRNTHIAISTIIAVSMVQGAFATKHVVQQAGFAFVPASITVQPGDTVRWVRSSGTHTVTSGANCTASGLFHAPLNITTPNFTWTVPASVAGTTVAYFCVPHCLGGMVGSIVVQAAAPSPDIDGNGAVNAADLASMLGNWGAPGSTDLDLDGSTGASDLSILLSAWTG